jgi:hypothetical protein
MLGNAAWSVSEIVTNSTICLAQVGVVAYGVQRFSVAATNSRRPIIPNRFRVAWLLMGAHYIVLLLGRIIAFFSQEIGLSAGGAEVLAQATLLLGTVISIWSTLLIFAATSELAGSKDLLPLSRSTVYVPLIVLSCTLIGLSTASQVVEVLLVGLDYLTSFGCLVWLSIRIAKLHVPNPGKGGVCGKALKTMGVIAVTLWAIAQLGRFVIDIQSLSFSLTLMMFEQVALLVLKLFASIAIAEFSQWVPRRR